MTQKTSTYTPDDTKQLLALWGDFTKRTQEQNDAKVQEIALSMNRKTRSIIAKLSKEGQYRAKEATTKTGGKPVKKMELAEKIGEFCGMCEADIESMTTCSKSALQLLYVVIEEAMQDTSDEIEAEELEIAQAESDFNLNEELSVDDALENAGFSSDVPQ